MSERKESQKLEITEEQLKNIKIYVASRLGMFGITSYDFGTTVPNKDGIVYSRQEIKIKGQGIFTHMLKEAELVLKIFPCARTETGTIHGNVILRFEYEHNDGGSNGHELDFSLTFNNSGDVYEVSKE